MDNPNISVSIRRHNSVPLDIRRRSTLLSTSTSAAVSSRKLSHQSNPYVGWFRHSPCTRNYYGSSSSSPFSHLEHTTSPRLKNSPYVGWFRHAPPRDKFDLIREHFYNYGGSCYYLRELVEILRLHNAPVIEGYCRPLAELLSGHLRGGTKAYRDLDFNRKSFHESSSTAMSSSVTVKLASRLAYWLLLPFHPGDYDLQPESIGNDDDVDDDEGEESSSVCSTDTEDDEDDFPDDHDCILGSRHRSPQHVSREDVAPMSRSISSQAEAYYLYTDTVKARNSDVDPNRLDYDITQMDIVRMTRNASRHLDVESIYKLPTITYKCKEVENLPIQAPQQPQQRGDEEGSWMMVQRGLEVSECYQQTNSEEESDDVCVICLEPFIPGDRLRVLPCSHSFHVGCIDRWLSGSHSELTCITSGCPTCKKRPDVGPATCGSVPAWAFARIGDALAKSAKHF